MKESYNFGFIETNERVKSRMAEVLELEKAGIKETPDTLGYTVLSLEELEIMVSTGTHPGYGSQGLDKQFYFTPTPRLASAIGYKKKFNAAEKAARPLSVVADAFLSKLGIEVFDSEASMKAYDFIRHFSANQTGERTFKLKQYFLDTFRSRIGTEANMDKLVDESMRFKGFLAALSQSAVNKLHLIYGGNKTDMDHTFAFRIKVPRGLPLEALQGLRSLGPIEKDYLKNLEEKVK